jgi:glycosyltransferase involved in cell wall biosynthesis
MISIVIPAYNEEKVIGACLQSFTKQTTTQPFEIILVNNNSTDKTIEKVKTFTGLLPLKIVSEKKKGRGPARRTGFLTAKGSIILSTDADTVIPPHWIEKMASYFDDGSIIAVTGTGKIRDRSKIANTLFNFVQPVSMKAYRLIFGHYWLTGFNFAITKEAYTKAGGFNTDLNTQEDTELAFRVRKTGKIKFIDDLPVIVSGRRYQNGLIAGFLPYISTFIYCVLLKKPDTTLSDPR